MKYKIDLTKIIIVLSLLSFLLVFLNFLGTQSYNNGNSRNYGGCQGRLVCGTGFEGERFVDRACFCSMKEVSGQEDKQEGTIIGTKRVISISSQGEN